MHFILNFYFSRIDTDDNVFGGLINRVHKKYRSFKNKNL